MRLTHTNDSLKALDFAERNTGWHTFKTDKRTLKAIERLKVLGEVEVNQYGQFKAI